MKDKHLIKYEIFCQRKKFSLKEFLIKNPALSYSEIKGFFSNRKTQPPEEMEFNRLKEEISKDNEIKNEDRKSQTNKKSSQDDIKNKEAKKTQPRRRRKRKVNAN